MILDALIFLELLFGFELVIFHEMHNYVMSEVVKVIELVGRSEQGWTEKSGKQLR